MTDLVAGQPDSSGRAPIGLGQAKSWPKRVAQWLAQRDRYDIASACLLIVLTALVVWTFQEYAVSNDEGVQHEYGELIIAYYKSGFADQSLFKFDNLYLYGGLFDIVAVLLSHVIPFDVFELRHLLCALIGIGGLAIVGATARLIAGPRAGFFAIVALALCGSWYGAMFNHTKGIPLATFMAGAVYFLIVAMRDLPAPRLRHVIGFGVLAGAALGIKSLSLLLIVYFGLALLISVPRPIAGRWKESALFAATSLRHFLPAFVIAYAIMIAAWPWAAQSLFNPIRGLLSFGAFHYKINTMLFGRIYEMGDVPRYYVPTYIVIRWPVLTLGAVLVTLWALASTLFRHRRENADGWLGGESGVRRRDVALIAFTAIFPVVCEVVAHGPAFDGCRHFMFVFPPIAVLAGLGFNAAVGALARWHRRAMIAGLALIASGYALTLTKLVELHPYQYLYYNQLVGGLQGASHYFVTDYWVNIMPEAVDELQDYLDRSEPKTAKSNIYYVAVCGDRTSYEEYARPNLHWTKMWRESDFYISPTHMNCDQNLEGKIIARIERMGVTIGVVKDRRGLRRPTMPPE